MAKYSGLKRALKSLLVKKDILNPLLTDSNITLPGAQDEMDGPDFSIRLEVDERTLYSNMQEASAAFDAWALIMHTFFDINVQLALKDGVKLPSWPGDVEILLGQGHYNRFLYRLMKFEQFYGIDKGAGWFKIADPQLQAAVARFARCLEQGSFCNNVGKDDAEKEPSGSEAAVEAFFATSGQKYLKQHTKRTDVKGIYRQLPVGLFWNKKGRDSYVFTGGHSAIDLWGLNQNGDTLVIYELKATSRRTNKSNKSVGIISELMFYCNYAHDMYLSHNNGYEPLSPEEAGIDGSPRSGYQELLNAYRTETLKNIQGYMLTDDLHPLITRDVLKEMNKSGITYHAIGYQWNGAEQVSDIKLEKIKHLF